jgi:diaminopimelate epimerase
VSLSFAKAHGLGNDFLLLPESEAPRETAAWARRLCERHVGVGADGILLYRVEASDRAAMRLINADGSEAELSGNGLRCLGAFLTRAGRVSPRHVVLTAAGPRAVEVEPLEGTRFRATCELGKPILSSSAIPVRHEPPRTPVVEHPLDVGSGRVKVTATSMGNPHCAVFCDEPAGDALLHTLGPTLERHPFFPRRTNVEFVTVVSRGELRVRFWERGVGYTQASGTGAASAAVAAVLTGRAERRVRVVCDGGVLEVEWPKDGAIRQTGEVEILLTGEWLAG